MLSIVMFQFTEDEIRQRLDPGQVITALETALRDRFSTVTMLPRTHLSMPDGIFLIMTCHDRARNTLGMKLVAVQNNPTRSDDRIQATYMLFDPKTSCPRLIIPANYLTDLRTAATSALTTKYLARDDARVLGIFGTGRQARAHLKILPLVREFQRILISGKNMEQSRAFAQKMCDELDMPIEPSDANICAAQADVICTCTTSQSPLFDGNLLRPGTHLNLVGAFQPHAREVESVTIQRARVVVDTYDGALAEAGDLLIPMSQNLISRGHLLADLHELLMGQTVIRRSREDITVFKSVGCALEDLATAELLITSP